jgi:hypothetical protein
MHFTGVTRELGLDLLTALQQFRPVYSYRNAAIGSIRIARAAGR